MRRIVLYLGLIAPTIASLALLGSALASLPRIRAMVKSNQLVDKAQALAGKGDRQAARAAVGAALASWPDNPRAHRELAMHLIAEGELSAAVTQLRAVARARPGDAGAARELGGLLAVSGDKDGALEWTRKAVGLEPDSGLSRAALARALLALRRIGEGRKEAERAANLAPQVPQVLSTLGLARWAEDDRPGAEAAFRKALSLRSSDAEAALFLADLAAKQGRPAEAAEHLGRVVALKPGSVTAWVSLGRVLLAAKRPDEARAAFQQALSLQPGNPMAEAGLRALDTPGQSPRL